MPIVKQTGVSQGLSVLSVVGSVVQTFSPVLYSVILTAGTSGINILAIAFSLCAVLFILTVKIDKQNNNTETKKAKVKN